MKITEEISKLQQNRNLKELVTPNQRTAIFSVFHPTSKWVQKYISITQAKQSKVTRIIQI